MTSGSGASGDRPDTEYDPEHVVIRDNRKIDRETGDAAGQQVGGEQSPPTAGPDGQPSGAGDITDPESDVPKAEALLVEERTRDLQRLQAEYANYRRRAERDRVAAGDLAVGKALNELLPVLDDLERAAQHGDLTGPLKSVADKLDGAVTKLGLEAFGQVGDEFDPAIHEAVLHDESDEVAVPTCTTVMRRGYRHRDRLLRPAMVGVSDPTSMAAPAADEVPAE